MEALSPDLSVYQRRRPEPGLATAPPAELGVIDQWMNDPDTLRIAGKIALSNRDIRALIVKNSEFQHWVKSNHNMGSPGASRSEDETRLPVRDMDEKGMHN